MPIYEYECPGCTKPFQKRVGFSDSDKTQECPHCGNPNSKRQISLIGGMQGGSGSSSASTGYTSAPARSCGPVG